MPFGCVGFASCEYCPVTNGPLAVFTAFRLYARLDLTFLLRILQS